ncbi:MAG: hypothetical protein ACK4WB_01065 [Desulfatiglandales bacterium]
MRPECFSDLDKVFPISEEGLRTVPEGCLACEYHLECLKEALNTPKALSLKEEKILRSEDPVVLKRLKLWSLKKEVAKKNPRESSLLFNLSKIPKLIFHPGKFYQVQREVPWVEALSFGLLWGGVGSMLGYFWQVLLVGGSLPELGPFYEGQGIGNHYLHLGLLIPLLVVLEICLTSLLWHLSLSLVGANRGGFVSTFMGVSTSQGVMILGLVPILGPMVSQLWKFWVQIVAMKSLHETTYGRIFLSFIVLVFFAIGLLVSIGGIVAYLLIKG